MADKRNRSHRASDRPDLTWPIWAEKYAPPTTDSSSDHPSRPLDDNVMRICHRDIGLYGLCPRQDECCLVVCNQCKQLIRLQALYGHYERRHSHYLTSGRHQHSSSHKAAYKNSNTNGPYVLPEKAVTCERRDSSSGSSDCLCSSIKETVVSSSSRRKLSLSSQWDSEDSESQAGDSDVSSARRDSFHNKDNRKYNSSLVKKRSSDISVSLSETTVKPYSKTSVQVNGVKIRGSSSVSQSAVHNSHQAMPAVVTSKSSKHIIPSSSSQPISESRSSVERSSKSSHLLKLESSLSSSGILSKTNEHSDPNSKGHSDYSRNSSSCKMKDSISRDKLGSVSNSSKLNVTREPSDVAKPSTKDAQKNSRACESSAFSFEENRSKSKHSSIVETKSLLNHPRISLSNSTSLPAASRSSSIEENRTPTSSKSSATVPSLRAPSGNVGTRTLVSDAAISSRSSALKDCSMNSSDKPVPDISKANWHSAKEPSRSSNSKSSSKILHSAGDRDPSPGTSRRQASKLSPNFVSPSNSKPKSASLEPSDILPEFKLKSDLKSDSRLRLDLKSDGVLGNKMDPVEVKNIPVTPAAVCPPEKAPAELVRTATESRTNDFGGSLENSILHRLSKKVTKSRDKPKSSSQFCKDREFDPDKHCGVVCVDTGKPCTHSLTCKIHALSLRRSVSGRTKPFDQLLSDHRILKEASLPKKREIQKLKLQNEITTPVSVVTSPPSYHPEAQRLSFVTDKGSSVSDSVPAACQPPVGNVAPIRPPRSRPKPRFRASLFHSSKWFSVLTPATNAAEKLIARPVKLPVFPRSNAVKLQDDDGDSAYGASEDTETKSSSSAYQNSCYLMHHPKPVAVNRFGAWKVSQGCNVFSRKEDLCRSMFEDMLENHLHPPPHKKLCVEASLPVDISDSLGPMSYDPYCFPTGDVPLTDVITSSAPSSSAFLSPVRKLPSKAKTRTSPFSAASRGLATFTNTSLNQAESSSTKSVSVSRLDSCDSETRLISQLNLTLNHKVLSPPSSVTSSVNKLTVRSTTNSKSLPSERSERSGNSYHQSVSESGLPLPNGQHPPSGNWSGKKRSHADDVEDAWYANDSDKTKMQRKVDDSKARVNDCMTRPIYVTNDADSEFKDSGSRFMDRHSGYRTSSSEASRPSVIAFGSPTSQKLMEISSHSTSSLSSLNGLQSNCRSLSSLNHKPQHISSMVAKDRHLGSQSSIPSSTPGLKNASQVNRTLGVHTT